jgi:hypothetical protein
MLFRPCGFHLLHFRIQLDRFSGALVLLVKEPSAEIVPQYGHSLFYRRLALGSNFSFGVFMQ